MADYKIGDKIRTNPDTLAHFNADYTGVVESFEGKSIIMVRMDRTKKLVPFGIEQMTKIERVIPPPEVHIDDHCPHCAGAREAHVDLTTGRCIMSVPRRCEDRDRCEKEIMTGFEFVADKH